MKKISMEQLIISIILTALAFGFSGCDRLRGGNKPDASAPAVPVFAVNTMNAVQGSISDYLGLAGDIVAASSVDAFSDTAGKVNRITISVGSRVSRGDIIAEVDPSRPGMEFIPSAVRAPVSGTIVALPAQLGMTVSQATPLARISGGSGLEIRLYVAERFISRISLMQNCEITLDAWPGEIFQGRITEISPVVDPASRTMEVRVTVDNPGSRLKAGMFAKVRIIIERKENIVKIPVAAMLNRFGEQYVFIVDYSDPDAPVARKRNIVQGILIDGVLEVAQGLAPNEEIVLRGQTLLEDGSRINIIERSAPLSAEPPR